MAKREFLQLAHKYNPKSHAVYGWYLSEKLDGIRAFWDGGITTGLPASEVPWANVDKDDRLKNIQVATGLWSRYGKVIHAPTWWVNKLPTVPLDGELWINHNSWQILSKIVKRLDYGGDWSEVKFMALDSPSYEVVFKDGLINTTHYKKKFIGIEEWLKNHPIENLFNKPAAFKDVYNRMKNRLLENNIFKIHEQEDVPLKGCDEFINQRLQEIVEAGGEGIILKNAFTTYECCRSYNVLKYKPFQDDEATVVGYVWGRETELGSKLLGLMGALIVEYNGQQFELSGFTDAERKMCYLGGNDASEEGELAPGSKVKTGIYNPSFPIGSKITFRYRELSDRGIPKEARYLRRFLTV